MSIFNALGGLLYGAAAKQIERDEYDGATRRWRKHNARQPRTCNCGAPGTVLRTDQGNVGAVPVEFWYCTEHADVPLTVPWSGGVPLWKQTREDCSWRTSSIKTGIVSGCGCGTHVGEQTRWPRNPAFTAADWYEIRDRGWVATFAGIPGFDPGPLLGQRVTIDGKEYTVKGVETGLLLDNSGHPFGLLVGER